MTIKDMQYDVKFKLNKVDSNQYRNLRIPEIDWALNEAQEILIKMVAEPRSNQYLLQKLIELGFQINQRSIDDIKNIVKLDQVIPVVTLSSSKFQYVLPDDYMFFHRARVYATKGDCENVLCTMMHKQTDDRFLESPFDNPSFKWREVPFTFYEGGIIAYTDGSFSLGDLELGYIRTVLYMHNAEDFQGGQYKLPNGVTLTGFQNSELSDHTHREIVDIAVLILSGQMHYPDYQIRRDKLNLLN